MIFAHDTERALTAMAALVNTQGPPDAFTGTDALRRFVDEWRWTAPTRADETDLVAVSALRPRLRRLWDADEDSAVAVVNGMLREFGALPRLVRHDEWDYHVHATSDGAPLADRMAVEAAMAVVDVIRQKELARMRTCAADGCGDVLVDLSKNRSRRFCDTQCGNRVNVANFRARRAGAA